MLSDMDPFNLVGASVSWDTLIYACASLFLVVFAGLMSGLTLGLMSLDVVELEVLQRSGTPAEKKQAAAILPVVKKQHQLLVTLLLCNAIAMEALPICLDFIFDPVVSVILSVTFVLIFGEILPQAVCSRYGLAIGANLILLVRFLMIVCFVVSYPVAKLLDLMLGHNDAGLFRRAQLKAFVSIHGKAEGIGGELTHDETTIISGALDLTSKTAEQAMTSIESTFSLDVDCKLDWEAIGRIFATGHSRVPVYSGNPRNIIGLLLVKSLLTVRVETETRISAVSIRKMPRVPADMPLYDILNEFQKGQSHMAAVVRRSAAKKCAITAKHGNEQPLTEGSKSGDPDAKAFNLGDSDRIEPEWNIDVDKERSAVNTHDQALGETAETEVSNDLEGGEVIGIITLEDVIEELLQEEIADETDKNEDAHETIKVAAGVSPLLSSRTSAAAKHFNVAKSARHSFKATKNQTLVREGSNKPGMVPNLEKHSSLTKPLLDKR